MALAIRPPYSGAFNTSGAAADTKLVPHELGPTRPNRLTIWPVEGDMFGIDVSWGGAAGLMWPV